MCCTLHHRPLQTVDANTTGRRAEDRELLGNIYINMLEVGAVKDFSPESTVSQYKKLVLLLLLLLSIKIHITQHFTQTHHWVRKTMAMPCLCSWTKTQRHLMLHRLIRNVITIYFNSLHALLLTVHHITCVNTGPCFLLTT